MKIHRIFTLTAIFVFSMFFASAALGQRGIGAHSLVLDDGHGSTVTITIPTMSPVGPYFWMLPITSGGVALSLPAGTTPNSTLYWNGSAWTENTNVLATSAGNLTAQGTITASGPVQFTGLTGTGTNVVTIDGAGNLGVGVKPAASGANSDITSLSGLTTPLSVGQGGTGSGTAPTAGGVMYAASTTDLASTPAGTSGQVLTSNGSSAPSWQDGLPSGAIVAFPNDNSEAGFTDWGFSQTFGTNAWTTGAVLPVGQGDITSAVVGGKIYVIGGANGSENNNQIYDPVTNTWTTGAVLPVGQWGMTSAVVGGKIYVIGGVNGSQNNNQIYDPVTNTWTTGAVLPVGQLGMTSTVVGGKIYVIGGLNGSQNNNQIYDPVTNTWTTGAVLPVGQYGMGSAVVGGKIYVIGGVNGSENNTQIYDPVANTWTTGAVLPVGQADMTSAVVGGKIYVIGGVIGSENNTQMYDPVANTWTTGAALPVGNYDMTCVVVGGKIYVIGGLNGSQNNNQIYSPGLTLYYFQKN